MPITEQWSLTVNVALTETLRGKSYLIAADRSPGRVIGTMTRWQPVDSLLAEIYEGGGLIFEVNGGGRVQRVFERPNEPDTP